MSDNKWIHIDNWMGKMLGLRANDLICFAVIYAFTRDGKTLFCGDLSYLAATMFATKPTVLLCLKKLLKQNLILKQEKTANGIKRCYYQTNIICDDGRFYKIDTSKEPLTASKEPLTVYINDNKENNKENKEKKEEDKSSPKKNRFIKPTIEQIDAYIKEKGYKFTAEQFYYHYESNGWIVGRTKMVDWKAACRNWQSQRKRFNKEESEEESADNLPDGITREQWTKIVMFFCREIGFIAGKITPVMFIRMKSLAANNSALVMTILRWVNDKAELDCNIDVMETYERLIKDFQNESETKI